MKQQLYEKMESMFHLIEHKYESAPTAEMILFQLARGNAFDLRVVGLEGIKRFRQRHPASREAGQGGEHGGRAGCHHDGHEPGQRRRFRRGLVE